MKKLRYLLLMVLALTLLAAAGCSDNKNNVGGDDNKTTITADKGSAPKALPDKEKEKAAKGKLTIKVLPRLCRTRKRRRQPRAS